MKNPITFQPGLTAFCNSVARKVCAIAPAVIGAGCLSTAQAQITEFAKVGNPSSNFVLGGGTSGYSNVLVWSGTGSSIGGGSELGINVVNSINANSASTNRLSTFGISGFGNVDANASLSLDLGSNVLVPDVAGYTVTQTSVKMIDFGATSITPQYYDFKLGLWNGSSLVFASALTDLSFTVGVGSGSLSYLGTNVFRFSDTFSGSGSDFEVSSALAGYSVRTFSIAIGGFEENSGAELVAFSASRTLTVVPEPQSFGLAAIALMPAMVRRRRSAPGKR